MTAMTAWEAARFFLALAVLLGVAKAGGALVARLRQPPVLGEILAGICLGPTLLGRLAPGLTGALFPAQGGQHDALGTVGVLGVVFFLFVAGLEVDLAVVWRKGRSALSVGVLGVLAPFALGAGTAWAAPELLGVLPGSDRATFALFIGTALSISALPVIARILLDLGLFKTEVGSVVLAAAMFNDLAGWVLFSTLLGMETGHGTAWSMGLWVVGFAALMVTAGRWLLDRALPWVERAAGPGTALGTVFALTLLSAALSERVGVHGLFGGFLLGVALADNRALSGHTREHVHEFVTQVMAPFFFASIGLRVDFVAHFDLRLTAIVIALAAAGKVLGCFAGARLGGMVRREAWAVGAALNARGAMEIILSLLALHYGLIGEGLFVALVLMALVTSFAAPPALHLLIPEATAGRGRRESSLP